MRMLRASALMLTVAVAASLCGCAAGNTVNEIFKKSSPFDDCKIVRTEDAYSYVVSREVEKLVDAVREKYETEIEIITDGTERESGKEIVIGAAREGAEELSDLDAYSIRSTADTVYLEGGSDRALMTAVTEFTALVNDGFKMTDGFIKTGSYKETVKSYGDTYFKRTWGDDFNGTAYDKSVWSWRSMNVSDIKQEMTERTCKVENGMLYLMSSPATAEDLERDAQHGYYSPYFLQTRNSMEYLYGCFEIKAKIPFDISNSTCFGFASNRKTERGCHASIDLVELLGSAGSVIANVHCWGNNHTKIDSKIGFLKRSYSFEGSMEEMNSRYHTYFMNWTPEYLDFGVDSEVFLHLDITEEGAKNFGMPSEADMDALHLPIYPILAEYLYSPARGYSYSLSGNEDAFCYTVEIDHVDIYQQDTLGEIYFLR